LYVFRLELDTHKKAPQSLHQTLQAVIDHMIQLTQKLFDDKLKHWQMEAIKDRIEGFISRRRGAWEMYHDGLLPALKSRNDGSSTAQIRDLENRLHDLKLSEADTPHSEGHAVMRSCLQLIIDSWLNLKQYEIPLITNLEQFEDSVLKDAKADLQEATLQMVELESPVPVYVELVTLLRSAKSKANSLVEDITKGIVNELKRRESIVTVKSLFTKLAEQIAETLDTHEAYDLLDIINIYLDRSLMHSKIQQQHLTNLQLVHILQQQQSS
jgi:hypothetical protein